MMRKRRSHKHKNKEKESIIEPNVEFAIDDISDYGTIFKSDPDLGYKGLKKMFEDRVLIRLEVNKNPEERDIVEGTISHYDDSYGQLVVVSGNSLKRLVFDQIIDVQVLNGDEGNEEFSK